MITPLAATGNSVYVAQVADSARSKTTDRGGAGRIKSRILMSVLVMLSILMGGTLATSTTQRAEANWFSDAIYNVFCAQNAYFNEPQPWQNGVTALGVAGSGTIALAQESLGSMQSGDANFYKENHTAFEKYGMSGTTWTVYSGEKKIADTDKYEGRPPIGNASEDQRRASADSRCIPVMEMIGSYFANSILGFTKFFTAVGGWILSNAYEPTWLTSLNDRVADIITGTNGQPGLRDTLYFPFLTLMIFLASLYLAWIGLVKRQSMEAATSALWMIGAVAVGSLFVYNPSVLPNAATSVVNEVTGALLVGTSGTTADNKSETNLCYLPDPGSSDIAAKRDFIVRGTNCTFWQTFVYSPWVVGQWGVPASELNGNLVEGSDNALTAAPAVKIDKDTTVNNWAMYQLDTQSMDVYSLSQGNTALEEKTKNWYRVVDSVGAPGAAQSYFNTWAGNDSFSRIGISMAALIASICGLVVVVVLAGSMLAYAIGTSILTFFAVIFLLLGAHPGMGRRLALRWAEMYVGTILKRIIVAAMLGVLLAFYNALLVDPTSNWGATVLAMIALSVAILMYRKEIMEYVGQLNFGGAGISNEGSNRATQMAKGAAGGALLGLAGGVAGGGKAAAAVMARPSAGKLSTMKKVASASAAGVSATTRGTLKGASHGAVHAGGYGRNQVLRAAQVGASAGDRTVAKERGALAQGQAAEQAKLDASDPMTLANNKRELDQSNARYARDFQAHRNDPEWNEGFKKKFGFPPPDPAKYYFGGYRKSREEIQKNPSAYMPRPIGSPPPAPETKQENGGGGNTPPTSSPRRIDPKDNGPKGGPSNGGANPSGGIAPKKPGPSTGGTGGAAAKPPMPKPSVSPARRVHEDKMDRAESDELKRRKSMLSSPAAPTTKKPQLPPAQPRRAQTPTQGTPPKTSGRASLPQPRSKRG